MKQPEQCPRCRGTDLHFAVKPEKYPGQWMMLCNGCLYNCAYGADAAAQAQEIIDHIKPPWKLVVLDEEPN